MKALLTNSRMKAYRLCPRLHRLSYVDGWRPAVQSDALNFGTAFHREMETYWEPKRPDPKRPLLNDAFDSARLAALVKGYYARWTDEDAKYRTLAVEKAFDLPLIHPITGEEHPFFRLAGKIDLIVADGDRVKVGEHKTSGEDISAGSLYWRRLDLDTQILIYLHAARMTDYEATTVLYDVAAKPRQRPKKNETPDQFQARIMEDIAENPGAYYARGELHRTEKQIDEALFDAWDWAEAIRRDMETGWAPRNVDGCHKYGRPCQFFDHCSLGSPLDTGNFLKLTDVHPELKEEAA